MAEAKTRLQEAWHQFDQEAVALSIAVEAGGYDPIAIDERMTAAREIIVAAARVEAEAQVEALEAALVGIATELTRYGEAQEDMRPGTAWRLADALRAALTATTTEGEKEDS